MSIDNVQDITPRRQYVATAGQTVFAYPFPIFADADLVVVVNNTTKLLTTDYTVSGSGTNTGGNVTLLVGCTVGDIVTIYRNIALARSTNFQQNGPLSSTTFNVELDRVMLMVQQVSEAVQRALRIPTTASVLDTDASLDPSTWAGKYLTFDSNGKPSPAALSSSAMTQAILAGLLFPRTQSEINGGIVPATPPVPYSAGDARRYGVVGDGATDDSAALQRAVDGNKGGYVYVPAGLTVLAAGILLSGSSYNNTVIKIDGTLKLKASGGATNFGGSWVGIILQSCDNVTIDCIDFDGNRANQANNEHILLLGIAGATNPKVPRFFFREVRGDGIYVGQATWGSSSANPTNVYLGQIRGINSADDGRNAISIISATGLTLDSLYSNKIGGTVNSVLEPGGLDLEPDAGYESITGVVIGNVNVTTAGTGGCQVFGRSTSGVDATRDWNISDVTIRSAIVQKTGTSGSGLNGINIFRCKDVHINGSMYFATANTHGSGWIIDFADRVYGALKARNVSVGVTCGFTNSLNDFELEVHVTDYTTAGLKTTLVTNGTFKGRVYGAAAASTSFAVQNHDNARGGIVQTNVKYLIDAPYDGVNVRAFRNEPTNKVTYTNSVARDCDWTGYASYTVCFDAEIPKIGIRGVNFATLVPANGDWVVGDRVANSVPAAGTVEGWARVTTGTANVLGTDWVAFGSFQAANAYTVTNPTTDRALNVTVDTLPQGLQVLGTLIADLQASGVLK